MATILRLLTSWELALRAERKAPKTIETYGLGVRKFAEWKGDVPPAEVTRDDVRGFLVHLGDKGFTDGTRLARYTGLRQFFGWLVNEEELTVSPMDRVKPPKVTLPKILVLTEEQAKRLVKIPGRDFLARRDTAILRLFLDTGMRAGALLGLDVDDVDLSDRIAYVRTKNDKHLACPFGFATAKALDDYLRARERHDDGHLRPLWLGQRGRLQRNGLRQMLIRRGEQAGIEGLHPHALRHTFADHWLTGGGTEGDLMALGGWKSRQMLDRYGAANKHNRARQAHERLALGDRL